MDYHNTFPDPQNISSKEHFTLGEVDMDYHHPQPSQELPSTAPSINESNQSESCGEEDDLSPLEYARLNGLSRDYLAEPYLVSGLDIIEDGHSGFTNDSHLIQFQLPTTKISTDERLIISKEAALLIACISREEPNSKDAIVLQMLGKRVFENHQLELPLLRSDHESDCRKFARSDGFEIKLQNVKFPLEMVDEEKNEGLGWSPKLWSRGSEILEELKREKLEVSKETLGHLQNFLKHSWTEEDEKELWASVQKYKMVSAPRKQPYLNIF